MRIEDLLGESPSEARRREIAESKKALRQRCCKTVIFGAGRLGRKTATGLLAAGFHNIRFADNDVRIAGSDVLGIPVETLATAMKADCKEVLFLISTFRPDTSMKQTMELLAQLGCTNQATFLEVGWGIPGILPHFGACLPSLILENRSAISNIASIWHDERSRETFRQQLEWRLRANFCELGEPAPDQYYPSDLILPDADEYFVDCGAYDGDTLRRARWSFARIVAFEPDPASAYRLRKRHPSIVVHELALGSKKEDAFFQATGTMDAARSVSGNLRIRAEKLDDMMHNECPTFIKFDIEGDELPALHGAKRLLERCQPAIAVALYHKPEDLWSIPAFLAKSLPNHRFHLRAHCHNGFELVAYAIPKHRSPMS